MPREVAVGGGEGGAPSGVGCMPIPDRAARAHFSGDDVDLVEGSKPREGESPLGWLSRNTAGTVEHQAFVTVQRLSLGMEAVYPKCLPSTTCKHTRTCQINNIHGKTRRSLTAPDLSRSQ